MQPVVDPSAVGLVGNRGAVAQPGQLRLDVDDGVQDFSQRPLAAADRAQVRAVRFGTGSVMRPVLNSSMPCTPTRRPCMRRLWLLRHHLYREYTVIRHRPLRTADQETPYTSGPR